MAPKTLADYVPRKSRLGFFDRAIENASGVVSEPVATEQEGAQQ
jgi:hypothetical protein